MLSSTDRKEQLSLAHVMALTSSVGYSLDFLRVDRDSIDVQVRAHGAIAGEDHMFSPVLDLQLKATACDAPSGEMFSFELKQKNYEDLRQVKRAVPALLVIYLLPLNESAWVQHSVENLMTQRCAYWCNLKGLPATDNEKSTTVKVIAANVFSPNSLTELMNKVARGEQL